MPFYTFRCERCNEDHEISMLISEYTDKQNCPICMGDLKRNFKAENISGFISDEPKTLGGLAEKNSKKFGIK